MLLLLPPLLPLPPGPFLPSYFSILLSREETRQIDRQRHAEMDIERLVISQSSIHFWIYIYTYVRFRLHHRFSPVPAQKASSTHGQIDTQRDQKGRRRHGYTYIGQTKGEKVKHMYTCSWDMYVIYLQIDTRGRYMYTGLVFSLCLSFFFRGRFIIHRHTYTCIHA